MNTSVEMILRPPTLDDLEAVYALQVANSLAAVGYSDASMNDLRIDWAAEGDKLGLHRRVVESASGQIIGYAEVDQDVPAVAHVDLYVHPQAWDTGVGEELIAWSEATARAKAVEAPADERCQIRTWTYAEDAKNYHPLLESNGFGLIRHFFRMMIDLDTPPEAAVFPAGFTVREAVAGQDERAAAAVSRLSFQDHFGYIERTPEAHFTYWWDDFWKDRMHPEFWWLAMDGDQIAGVCLGENSMNDDTAIGWIGTLGVLREFRRRGLARALLLHSFHEYYRHGKRAVGLGVDASSLTGAVDLYLNAGMRVTQRYDLLEKELRPGRDVTRRSLES